MNSGVIDSQVINVLLRLAEVVPELHTIAFDGWRQRRANRQLFQYRQAKLSQVELVKHFYIVPGYQGWYGETILRLLLTLTVQSKANTLNILHCRGEMGIYFARQLRQKSQNLRLVFDRRGDILTEFLYEQAKQGVDIEYPQVQAQFAQLKKREQVAVSSADHILCVSEAMMQQLQQRYNVDESKISVNPCAADENLFFFDPQIRQYTRSDLGLEDSYVIVYSGSTRPWQLPERMIEVFKLCKTHQPNAHFLWMTPDFEIAAQYLAKQLPEQAYTLMKVKQDEVANYLMAGDVALLLRESSPLNEVASPVKFAEYIMCGLPVILTRGIGDTAKLVSEYNLGLILDNLRDDTQVQIQLEAFLPNGNGRDVAHKMEIAQIGKQYYSLTHNVERLVQLYKCLNEA